MNYNTLNLEILTSTTEVRIRDLFFISIKLKIMGSLKILSMEEYVKQVEKAPR